MERAKIYAVQSQVIHRAFVLYKLLLLQLTVLGLQFIAWHPFAAELQDLS